MKSRGRRRPRKLLPLIESAECDSVDPLFMESLEFVMNNSVENVNIDRDYNDNVNIVETSKIVIDESEKSFSLNRVDSFKTSLPALCFKASSPPEKSEILSSYLLANYKIHCHDPEAIHIPWSKVELIGIDSNFLDFD